MKQPPPSDCFTEARRAIQKFHPRNEADAVRHFLKRSRQTGTVSQSDAQATLRILSQFEGSVRGELDQIDATFDKIRSTPNVSVFPLTDSMLKLSVELSLSEVSLQPPSEWPST